MDEFITFAADYRFFKIYGNFYNCITSVVGGVLGIWAIYKFFVSSRFFT